MSNPVSDIADKLTQNALFSLVCGLVIVATYLHFKNKYSYWSKLGLKGDVPTPFIGEYLSMAYNNQQELQLERTRKYGPIYGVYTGGSPSIMVTDPEIIRQILIKDFDSFTDHSTNTFANKYQRNMLVWIKGNHWKKTRTLMTPTFTSGKIKRMFKLIDSCADDLIELIGEELAEANNTGSLLNMKKVFSYFTMDGITTCCYGLKLERESKIKNGKKAGIATRDDFVNTIGNMRPSAVRLILTQIIPHQLLAMLGFELTKTALAEPVVQRIEKLIEMRRNSKKKTTDFLQSIVDAKFGDKMELNEMDLKENHHAGLTEESLLNDQQKMINDVMRGNETKNAETDENFKLNDLEIKAEALLMIGAGYETTSILLTSCTYSLAFHKEIQQRLYEELKKIAKLSEDGKYHFDYEDLTSCSYIDAVISETLRFLSPAAATDRIALCDYSIDKYNVVVPKGTRVLLGIHSVHNNPKYWDNPRTYNPDRFLPGNKEKIVPGTYLPFSMGPRHCIGMRFSLTEAKLGLAKTIMSFKFEPAPDTVFPPELSRTPGLIKIVNPIVRAIARE